MSIKISYTANNRYKASPRSWYLYYVRNLRPKQFGSALMFGSAIDVALNTMLNNKKLNENNDYIQVFENMMKKQEYNGKKLKLPVSDTVKYFKSDLDSSIWTYNDYELSLTCKHEWVTLRRKGLMMLEAYKEQVLPHLGEIVAVQEYVKIENDNGDQIIGWKDFVAKFEPDVTKENYNPDWEKWRGKTIIWDNKTSSQNYKEDSVRTSEQLGTYFESPTETYNADACGYIVIPKKFRKKKLPIIPIQFIIDDVDEDIINNTFDSYSNTIHGIKMGHFPCTGECLKSPFGCDYKMFCASNGKNIEGLEYVNKNTSK